VWLEKKPERISLLDIYRAVDAPKAFAIHPYAEQKTCPVSCRIKVSLEKALEKTQTGILDVKMPVNPGFFFNFVAVTGMSAKAFGKPTVG
jgi:Iron-dependent Transcriptional regulator